MTAISREALIKRLRTETWSGFQSMALQAADMLEADAQRMAELAPLSVTNIMLDVVPGDGSGVEVFAKSTSDVEDLLTKMGEKIEDFESSKWAQQVAVPDATLNLEIEFDDGEVCEITAHGTMRDMNRLQTRIKYWMAIEEESNKQLLPPAPQGGAACNA